MKLGQLSSLLGLCIFQNPLEGGMPSELAPLPNPRHFGLSSNRLTSGISPDLGRFSRLRHCGSRAKPLAGEIPAEQVGLRWLCELRLSANNLEGEIRADLGPLSRLGTFFVSGNRLGRCIPENWRRIHMNDLSDTGVPSCNRQAPCSNGVAVESPAENGGLFFDCALLLDFRGTLVGCGSQSWSEDLSISGPKGQIPARLAVVDRLQTLCLSWNQLGGGVPSCLGGHDGLWEQLLEWNRLWGCKPSPWRTLQDSDPAETRLPLWQ